MRSSAPVSPLAGPAAEPVTETAVVVNERPAEGTNAQVEGTQENAGGGREAAAQQEVQAHVRAAAIVAAARREHWGARNVGVLAWVIGSPFAHLNYVLSVCQSVLEGSGVPSPKLVPILQFPFTTPKYDGWRFRPFTFSGISAAMLFNFIAGALISNSTPGSAISSITGSLGGLILFYAVVWTIIAIYAFLATVYNFVRLKFTICYSLMFMEHRLPGDSTNELYELTAREENEFVAAVVSQRKRDELREEVAKAVHTTEVAIVVNLYRFRWLVYNFFQPFAYVIGNMICAFILVGGIGKARSNGTY